MKKILNELEAYHGSPYDFDKFAVKYLGNGEGNQAHGYGLYFALNPDTSENYRERLTDRDDYISEIEYNSKSYKLDTIQGILLKGISKNKEIFLQTIQVILSDKKWLKTHQNILPKLKKVLYIAQKINPEKIKKIQEKITLKKGQFYTVEIPNLDEFIKENIPFEKQSKFVQDALHKGIDNDRTFLYGTNRNDWNNNPNKTMALKFRKVGIKGIYYNGYEDGDCVTIFNSKDIKIKNKKFNYSSKDDLYSDISQLIHKGDYRLNNASKEVRKLSLENNPYNIQYIDKPTKEEQLISINGEKDFYDVNPEYPIIYYITNPCKEAQIQSVKLQPFSIKYITNPCKEAIKIALDNDGIDNIENPTKEMMWYVLKNTNDVFNTIKHFSWKYEARKQMDEKMWDYSFNKDPRIIKYIPYPEDNKIIKAINYNPLLILIIDFPSWNQLSEDVLNAFKKKTGKKFDKYDYFDSFGNIKEEYKKKLNKLFD